MDREFILRNQIVERYIGGRLPLKGAQDFERFCAQNPKLLDEISLTDRINAALRLLEAGGRAPPWEQPAKSWWQSPWVLIAAGALAIVGLSLAVAYHRQAGSQEAQIAALQQRIRAQPLDPALSTRSITLLPSRTAPSRSSLATIGGAKAEMADIKVDVSWSTYTSFLVKIDRVDQGRVAVLHGLQRDSNGAIHFGLNSSALGPGEYQLSFEGLTWRGEAVPQAWATISIAR